MAASRQTSAGAREERRQIRAYLHRRLSIHGTRSEIGLELQRALDFIDARRTRYDAKRGGLGKR